MKPISIELLKNYASAGNRVVMGFHGQEVNSHELGCDRQLILVGNEFQVVPI